MLTKQALTQELRILNSFVRRTGDPLGLKLPYWSKWKEGLELPQEGDVVFFTGRTYQMLPYIASLPDLLKTAQKALRGGRIIGTIANVAARLVGEEVLKAKALKIFEERSIKILNTVATALLRLGVKFTYFNDELYSGALLYDVGLDENLREHLYKIYRIFEQREVKEIICVDPHTTLLLREIGQHFADKYRPKIRHYFEILLEKREQLREIVNQKSLGSFVIHDACVMARDLRIIEEPRELLRMMGVTILEPETTKNESNCCGAPIDYAYPELSKTIARRRLAELATVSKNVVVECPFCLLNLSREEKIFGVKVWDFGEVLAEAMAL